MPTLVNSYSSEVFADPTNITITAVGSGNSICLAIKVANGAQPIVSVTDNQSNTYALDYTTSDQTDDADVYFYSCHNITNAPTQVSIDTTGNNLSDYGVFEFSGLAATGALDETNLATGNSTTPSVGFTTDSANQAVVAILMMPAGRNVTADSPYTEYQPYADPVFDTFLATADIGTAGAKTASATLNTGVAWKMAVVSYRAASSGPAPTAGSLSLAGVAPSVTQQINSNPVAGALSMAGVAPVLTAPNAIAPLVGSISLSGIAPLVTQQLSIAPSAGTMTMTGAAPSLSAPTTITPTVGALAFTGIAPSLELGVPAPLTGSLVISGLAPTVITGIGRVPVVGSISISGVAPTVSLQVYGIPLVGALTLSGVAPTVTSTGSIQPSAGELVLTGTQAVIGGDRAATPSAGALVLSGNQPVLDSAVSVQPSTGQLAFTGVQAGVSLQLTITPSVGALAMTGIEPQVLASRFISPTAGALAIAGASPVMTLGILTPQAGSLAFNGGIPGVNEQNPNTSINGFGPARRMRLWL